MASWNSAPRLSRGFRTAVPSAVSSSECTKVSLACAQVNVTQGWPGELGLQTAARRRYSEREGRSRYLVAREGRANELGVIAHVIVPLQAEHVPLAGGSPLGRACAHDLRRGGVAPIEGINAIGGSLEGLGTSWTLVVGGQGSGEQGGRFRCGESQEEGGGLAG